jgi:membrane protease YdiL (CAAX protease family)
MAIWAAGTCEELLFRGFLLNKFGEFMSFTQAMLATSLLFVFAHIPGWLIFTGYSPKDVLFNGLYVFFISLIFSIFVKVSNSLYPSIVFHSIADIIAF